MAPKPEPEKFDVEALEITDEIELIMEVYPWSPGTKPIVIKPKKNSVLVRLIKNNGPLGEKFFIMSKAEFEKRYRAVDKSPEEKG